MLIIPLGESAHKGTSGIGQEQPKGIQLQRSVIGGILLQNSFRALFLIGGGTESMRQVTRIEVQARLRRHQCWFGGLPGELGQPLKSLGEGGEEDFIFDGAQAAQPEPVKLMNALHAGESHLHLLALASRLLKGPIA